VRLNTMTRTKFSNTRNVSINCFCRSLTGAITPHLYH
jgi:hypothetical protein